MIASPRTAFVPGLVLAINVLLGLVMIGRAPDVAWIFLIAIAALPLAWAVLEVSRHRRLSGTLGEEDRASLRFWIGRAGLMILLPLSLTVLFTTQDLLAVSDATEQRSMGIAFGVLCVLIGNILPKRPVSLSGSEGSPRFLQGFSRFAGLCLILAGLAYAGIWALAPLDWASPAAFAALLAGCGAILGRAALARLRRH